MSVDPFTNLSNSGNPILAAFAAGSAAASSIVRNGLRGECGLCETLEVFVSLVFKPGVPGRDQVRIIIIGAPFLRRWTTIHLRQGGYCGIHNIDTLNERQPASESCRACMCREVWIPSEEPRTTVASSLPRFSIPQPGMWVLVHSPCCSSWRKNWKTLDGKNGLEYSNWKMLCGNTTQGTSNTFSDSLPDVKLAQCLHNDGPWSFIVCGPSWDIEMKRVGKDTSLTPDESNNNYSGPAGNILLNGGPTGWQPMGSRRHIHAIWILLLGQLSITLAVAWYSVAGPLICCMAGRRAVASYINGSSNHGIGLVNLDDTGYLLINQEGKTRAMCFRQKGVTSMTRNLILCSSVGIVEILGSWALMLSKAYLISHQSITPGVERKVIASALSTISIVLAIGGVFKRIPGKQNNVGGAFVTIALIFASSALGGTVMWFGYLDAMHGRCIIEIAVLLGWLGIKCVTWIQQYVRGGAIDPTDYSNLEGCLLLLSGTASLLSLRDPYSI